MLAWNCWPGTSPGGTVTRKACIIATAALFAAAPQQKFREAVLSVRMHGRPANGVLQLQVRGGGERARARIPHVRLREFISARRRRSDNLYLGPLLVRV